MKKSTIILIVIGALFLLFCGMGCSRYNGMVDLSNNVDNAWGNLQSEYETRNSLIPGLVNTVKGAATHETEVLTQVTELRAQAQSLPAIDFENADSETLSKYLDAQQRLTENLHTTISAVAEAYPQITATESFLKLQDQIEGTWRRVNTCRKDFNTAVTEYNKYIQKFPTNIFASFFGYEKKPVYQAPAGAEQAPTVEF